MNSYTWEEYYEKFYDWAESTQVKNLSYLTSLGPADEVAEIITELQVCESAANRLLKMAVSEGLKFKAKDLVEFLCICDKALATLAVFQSIEGFSEVDMEELYGYIEDSEMERICREKGFLLPLDLRDDADEEAEAEELAEDPDEETDHAAEIAADPEEDTQAPAAGRERKGTLLTILAAAAGLADGVRGTYKENSKL